MNPRKIFLISIVFAFIGFCSLLVCVRLYKQRVALGWYKKPLATANQKLLIQGFDFSEWTGQGNGQMRYRITGNDLALRYDPVGFLHIAALKKLTIQYPRVEIYENADIICLIKAEKAFPVFPANKEGVTMQLSAVKFQNVHLSTPERRELICDSIMWNVKEKTFESKGNCLSVSLGKTYTSDHIQTDERLNVVNQPQIVSTIKSDLSQQQGGS